MEEPWPLDAWPNVPTAFFSAATTGSSQRASFAASAQERLGTAPDEIDGGHCVALSRPMELADRLVSYTASAPS